MIKTSSDNVRQRKDAAATGTQRYLPIAEIFNDTVILKNGGLRAVVRIEATNFHLKSETEQEAIIAGYGAFLNTITFPIQILVRSTHIDIDTYLAYLRARIGQQKDQLLLTQATFHLNFIMRLLEVADLMQKHFYLIVPTDRNVLRKTLRERWFAWRHVEGGAAQSVRWNAAFSSDSRALKDRVELVQAGLNAIGLHSSRLRTRELIQLYYESYNPTTSQHQKIPQDITELNTDVASF